MNRIEISPHLAGLHLFEGYGIELEYMIVDNQSLDVKPITDQLFYDLAGRYTDEVDCGIIGYSNELALHVVEMRNMRPVGCIQGIEQQFQDHVRIINQALNRHGAMLLPTGAHPWMDPYREMQLWPHDHSPVYEAYHRIFDCRGHGWANLQSTHINLSFSGDEEFCQLHAAIRFILPLLPALAASSPILEGAFSGKMDKRLDVYRSNQKKIPSLTGYVIPEAIESIEEYKNCILKKIYADIKPYDAAGVLQEEWLNARGAIARFNRGAIEIRVLDIQECPLADCAIASAIVYLIKKLIASKEAIFTEIRTYPLAPLKKILLQCVKSAELAKITDLSYLNLLGIKQPLSASAVWKHLLEEYLDRKESVNYCSALENILNQGSLARRIYRACQRNPGREGLRSVYRRLADSLQAGSIFYE